jgi:hypothetical protein
LNCNGIGSASKSVDGNTIPGSEGNSSSRGSSKKWRLLWRGGLELGPEGYPLDGECHASWGTWSTV